MVLFFSSPLQKRTSNDDPGKSHLRDQHLAWAEPPQKGPVAARNIPVAWFQRTGNKPCCNHNITSARQRCRNCGPTVRGHLFFGTQKLLDDGFIMEHPIKIYEWFGGTSILGTPHRFFFSKYPWYHNVLSHGHKGQKAKNGKHMLWNTYTHYAICMWTNMAAHTCRRST